ncbi:MAG: hypothetical protein PUP92_10515 [Rhizonema sp. PD38]|nr:hypothetical protein [Rhizonema sp. PD38]
MKLRSLHSEDLETAERVEVEADLVMQDRNDDFLVEQIVSRLSLEPGISEVSWRIVEQEYG